MGSVTSSFWNECMVLWPAWQELASYVSTSHPTTADPREVFGAACACDRDRLIARLYGAHAGETLQDAERILDHLLAMARDGKRPRFGRELGLTPEILSLPIVEMPA